MDKKQTESIMKVFIVTAGVGIGLWLGSSFPRTYAFLTGIGIVFISAVVLAILSYQMSKEK